MPQVFIIHSQADLATVRTVRDALKKAELDAWVDSIDCDGPRHDWMRQNLEVLRSCTVGLYILSAASLQSDDSRLMAQKVLDDQKHLYIALTEVLQIEDFPDASESVHYFEFYRDDKAELARLITEIRRNIPRARPAAEAEEALMPLSLINGPFPRWQKTLPLIGREQELKSTLKSLSSEHRVTALVGPAGVGKTRIAVEAALHSKFKHGIIWHNLSPNSTLADLTTLVRSRLGLDPHADSDTAWTTLGTRQVLLVLDDAEECRHRRLYAEMANMLDLDCGTRILMTTRQRWSELHDVRVIDIKAPSPEVAENILREMLERERPSFAVAGFESHIAHAAHYRPKLMRYAVRWADSFPPDYVLDILRSLREPETEQAFDDLVLRTIRLVDKHEHWPAAKNALQRLAVTSGSFSFDAARALVKEARAIQLLREWGLLTLENSRYTIDPLLLTNIPPDESACPLHFAYYLAEAEKLSLAQDYTTMNIEYGNFRAAFEWAITQGQFEDAVRLAKACGEFMAQQGRLDERKTWFERLAAKVSNNGNNEPPNSHLHAEILMLLGIAYTERLTGDRKTSLYRAVTAFEKAARYFTPNREPLAYAQLQNNLGITYRNLSELKDSEANLRLAIACFEQAVKYYTPQAAPTEFGAALNNLGGAYLNLAGSENRRDNLWKALNSFRRALTVLNAERAPIYYGLVQNNLGAAYSDMADLESDQKRKDYLDKAVEAFKRALRFLTIQRAPMPFARTMVNLGHTLRYLAEINREPSYLNNAATAYLRALGVWTTHDAPIQHASIQSTLGMVYLDLGEAENSTAHYQHAANALRQALALYSPRHNMRDYVTVQTLLGITYKCLGNIQMANTYWQDAEQYFRKMNEPDMADRISRWISGEIDPRSGRNLSRWLKQSRF